MEGKEALFDLSLLEFNEDHRIVKLSGYLDLHCTVELRRQLRHELENSLGKLVIDLSDVEFIDLAAVGVLVGLQRKAETYELDLILIKPTGRARLFFDLARVDEHFHSCSSVEEVKLFDAAQLVKLEQLANKVA